MTSPVCDDERVTQPDLSGGPPDDPTSDQGAPSSELTAYDQMGGRPAFERLVTVFYDGVSGDDLLRPLYPEADLGPAHERLLMFLEQYWGGPHTYSDRRGHPRLRMRHAPFAVTPLARDRWLLHMRTGVDAMALPPALDEQLWGYLVAAAHSMVNTFEE